MAVEHDIAKVIDRLNRAGIPLQNLCYEVDAKRWQRFMRHLERYAKFAGMDLSASQDCYYLGLHIRKRRPYEQAGMR